MTVTESQKRMNRLLQTIISDVVLDEAPRWAEVSYPLSGQDWALRVTWEEEP